MSGTPSQIVHMPTIGVYIHFWILHSDFIYIYDSPLWVIGYGL